MKWFQNKGIAAHLFDGKRAGNPKLWIWVCGIISLLSLLFGALEIWGHAVWHSLFFFLPTAAFLALLSYIGAFRNIPRKPNPDAYWQTVLHHLALSYAVTVLRPSSSGLSDFHIVKCSPHFPDWFAIDRKRMPGMMENGFLVYNKRMHVVLRTKESTAFCACDRLGTCYDMQALYIGKKRVLLLSKVAVEQERIGGSAVPIKECIEKLQSSDHELEALNYSISHEIKAPVRAVDGYARIFLEDYGTEIDQDAAQMIGNIRSICGDTILLINKMLEYTKISAEEPKKEIVNLESMLQDVFDELRVSYVRKNDTQFQFDTKIPPVIGDAFLLRQAMTNILSNAFKFTREKPLGMIRAGFMLQNGEAVFYIRDNGLGFDMQFAQKLFGMFQRMHSPEEFEGSGIGLATVKKIVQKHGGRVWITGKVGNGATVYFTLTAENVLNC